MGGDGDETSPAHVRQEPEWVTSLATLAARNFKRVQNDAVNSIMQKNADFTMSLPIWVATVLNMCSMTLPAAWPLEGAVEKAYEHYYQEKGCYAFPPPGHIVEVSFYKTLAPEMVRKLQRDSLGSLYLAWLMLLRDVQEKEEKLAKIVEAAMQVPMKFTKRNNDNERVLKVYQYKEDEEKNAELLGHSLLGRARELAGLQEVLRSNSQSSTPPAIEELFNSGGITWAHKETTMNLYNIRLHLRILRRLSMAVADVGAPAYKDSALCYFDRNEEIWGRKHPNVTMQETGRSFDAFQSAVPDLGDLRVLAETYHVMLLRGYNVKASGRHAPETAKTLKTFHKEYPSGLDFDGKELLHVSHTYPILGEGTAEKLNSEILLPTMLNKKFQAFLGHPTALAVPFIKDMLPELDQLYQVDVAERRAKERAVQGEREEFDVAMSCEASGLITEDEKQPMIAAGASRLWFFNAGTDSTKDPNNKASAWRMKATPDEDHINQMVNIVASFINESDSAVIVSGRNKLFHRAAKKMVMQCKPKLAVKELEMLPDEGEVSQHLRVESSVVGTVDLTDQYLHIMKTKRAMDTKRGLPRRFVPGNTAFRTMAGIPVVSKDSMVKVSYSDREAVFKHVCGSEKWTPGAKAAKGQDLSDDDDDEAPEDTAVDPLEAINGGTATLVVLFWMELHLRAGARVLINFTPGAGHMIKAAFMLSVKSIVVRHNEAHVKVLSDVLRAHLLDEIQKSGPASSRFLPADKDERLEKCKPERLKLCEMQRKRSAGDSDLISPEAKRTALGSSVDAMLASLEGTPTPKAKAKARAKGSETPEAEAGSSPAAGAEGSAGEAGKVKGKADASSDVAGPAEDLQALLAQWSNK
ncbi:unnamed protein product [Prorocentrum cordatum]|uniref:Uncharacterized protein n=1 Tax=Prorocentrum cordatum TaxID=2364126 RepID=A0ABN9UBH0_9DINO|nr:unnamed protein product [Polarella glacialis]